MKYLFIILFLVGLSSAIMLYSFWSGEPRPSQDVALSINGYPMSQKQIDAQIQNQGYHGGNREDQVEALVSRRLLLQEAQRLGIDKEEGFRKALELYYEQSLIKVLTDRKLASISIDVSEQDIERYISCSGKMYTFTETPINRGKMLKAQALQHTVLFDNLSDSLRLLLSFLQPGESASKYDTGTEVSSIRLDKVEKVDAVGPVVYDHDRVKELLSNYQRGREVDRWSHALREKASVVVYDEEKIHD